MYFRLGTRYTHQEGELTVRNAWEIHRDDADRAYAVTQKWTLAGELITTDSATLLTQIYNLEQAYNPRMMATVGFAGLFFNSTTPSHIYWNAPATISGIKMTGGIRYPIAGSVQHLTCRNYEIDLEAMFEIPGASPLISFNERLEWRGNGGPRIACLETRNTDPVFQQVSAKTPVMLMQTGQCTGRRSYAESYIPNPLFPQYLQNPDDALTYEDPKPTQRGLYTNFTVKWAYQFILPRRVRALPHYYPR